MICAADELGLGDDHSGILVLAADTKVGLWHQIYMKFMKTHCMKLDLLPIDQMLPVTWA